MAEMEQEQSRSEPATPHKLEEARKRGSVAKSLELNSLLMLGGALLVAYLWGMQMSQEFARLNASILAQAHEVRFEAKPLLAWLGAFGGAALRTVAPLFIVLVLVALVSGLAQSGVLFTTFPLKPDFKRLNPVAGFKRIFSKRAMFELAKGLLKISLFGWAFYLLFDDVLAPALALFRIDPRAYPTFGFGVVLKAATTLIAILALTTLVDVIYTRVSYKNQLKMSRRELKQEIKNREGDPRIRQRVRELQRELVRRAKAIKRVPEADVLITNPTHLAIALLYRSGEMAAPTVVAKGAGDFAEHMRAIARRHRVPIIEQRELARSLFIKVGIDQSVPQTLYPQVARVLLRAYTLRGNRALRADA